MAEDESYIVKRRDLADIIQLRKSDALAELFEEPLPAVVETIMNFVASGPVAMASTGLHIVEGALKGQLLQQVSREINDLRKRGKIAENFAEIKLGYQTWVELMRTIDEDLPDEERLVAMKAMFFSVNRVNSTDGEMIVAYQLFQIAKKLTSGELLLLKASFYLSKNATESYSGFRDWAAKASNYLGHGLVSLIEHDERTLMEMQLLSGRLHSDRSGVEKRDGRLTDLGLRFCKNIDNYHIEAKAPSGEEAG